MPNLTHRFVDKADEVANSDEKRQADAQVFYEVPVKLQTENEEQECFDSNDPVLAGGL